MKEWKLFTGVFVSALVLTSTVSTFGQQKQAQPDRPVVFERERVIQGPIGPEGPPPHDFMFVASEMNFDGKLVKGAPYSAQALTETTQILSDGNRIINKSAASVYRDSEGRTRREQTLRAIGPFATAGDTPQTIFINDPVTGVNYALDPRSRVARKMAPMRFDFKIAPPPGGERSAGGPPQGPPPERAEMHSEVFLRSGPPPPPGAEGGVVMEWHGGPERGGKTESLGRQTIEGVEAEGTRNTTTIPTGEIGNERSLEIVFERWYSPELQTVVMTRHADPRFGETIYRLTNISRDEPVRSLFEVPANYTVKEGPTMGQKIRMRSRIEQ
ncbi:MAG: hypothetical protein ACR2G5_01665 [Pyrinomonadaceae bacterium]